MAALVLAPVSALINLTSQKIHPTLYPFPLVTTLHAARISLAFQGRVRVTSGKLPFMADLTGFLLMCWGGSLLSHFLLSLPAPPLLSPLPFLNYASVHLLLSLVPSSLHPNPKFLDLSLPLLDAVLRTGAIIGGISLVASHPNTAISSSLYTQLLIGAVSSSGGGVTATTLNLWSPSWTLATPPFLKGGVVDSLDVWSGSLVAAIYGGLSGSHKGYASIVGFEPFMTPLGARTVATVVLAALYAWRAWVMHVYRPGKAARARAQGEKGKGKKAQ